MTLKRPLTMIFTAAMLSAVSLGAFAQDNTTPAAPVETEDDDNDGFDLGWLGLLGLAGLAGLRGRRHDTTHVRSTTNH